MVRQINRLTARKVASIESKGLYADGGGLYLQVSTGGGKSWIYRYRFNGRTRDMGLGSARAVTLAAARARAAYAATQRANGLDPILAARPPMTFNVAHKEWSFDDASAAFIAAQEPGWKNAKHRAQWRSTLAKHASPIIGHVGIDKIETIEILATLEPIWTKVPETASRLRGRIEAVLDWAKARGLRTGENPARWRGHLQSLLPPRSKIQNVRHHASLPIEKLPEFMAELRANASVSARALEFLILTASRTGETIGARWDEIDLIANVWSIPGIRMKGGRPHRVPLCARAVTIIKQMQQVRSNAFVFPGTRRGEGLSSMALLMLLRRLGRDGITVHGFRSTFRDWVSEHTDSPREVAEAALAHAIGDRVEAAYRRGDLFIKRRELMNSWDLVCHAQDPLNVTQARGAKPRSEELNIDG